MVMSATISTAVLVITVMLASGCATTAGLVGFGKESEKQVASASCASEDRMLDRWSTISGVLTGRAKRTPANPTPGRRRSRRAPTAAVLAHSRLKEHDWAAAQRHEQAA